MSRHRNRRLGLVNGWRKPVLAAVLIQPNRWRCVLDCGHVVELSTSTQPKNVLCGQCKPSSCVPGNHTPRGDA